MKSSIIPMLSFCLLASLTACKRQQSPGAIVLSGNIEVVSIDASFRIPGRLVEMNVDEGDRVAKGQVLARLESDELRQQLLLREAEGESARAALDLMLQGSRREDIEASQAALDAAKAELCRMEPEAARTQALYEKGILTAREREASQASLSAAKAKVRQLEQQALAVRKGPRPEEIRQGRARVEQTKQAIALTRTQMDYATLLSPISGTALSRNVEPMEVLSAGVSVLSLADLDNVFLRAYLEEPDLPQVKLGQKAQVRADGHASPLEGRVTFIAQDAEFTPKSIQTRKERVKLVYRIKIAIPNPGHVLKPGMPATAELLQ